MMELTTAVLVAGFALAAAIAFNGVVALLHYRHDRQRHGEAVSEAALERVRCEIASAFVRYAPKGDKSVVRWLDDPVLKYYGISYLAEAAGALTAFVRNYPEVHES